SAIPSEYSVNPPAYAAWQFSALAGVLDALDHRGSSLRKLHAAAGPELRKATWEVDWLFYQARGLADHACRESDRGLADANRQLDIIPALRMLGLGLSEYDEDLNRLARFLQPQFPLALQQAALAGL